MTKTTRLKRPAATAVFLVLLHALWVGEIGRLPVFAAPPSKNEIQALAQACLVNRQAFPFFTCKYAFTVASAESIQKAIRGEFANTPPPATSAIRWIVDKEWVLYDEICDPGILKEAEDKARLSAPAAGTFAVSTPLASNANITDGSYKLTYMDGMKSANIFDPSHNVQPHRTTPFAGNMMGENENGSPGNLLNDCIQGKRVCHSITTAVLDGRTMIAVDLGETAEKVTRTYWLDPDKGFLPVRGSIYAANGEETLRCYWTDVGRVSGERWFPSRWVAVSLPNRAGPYRVRELKVTLLDVDKPPRPDDFKLKLSAGASISDSRNAYAGTTIKTEEFIRPDGLKALHQRCLSQVAFWEAHHASAVAQYDHRWPFGIISAGAALTLAILSLGWYQYKRRVSGR
jgi:hypothetical protein